MIRNKSIHKTDLYLGAGICLVSLLFHMIYFRYGVQNLVDLGVACTDSMRVLEGKITGRDFFDPYGPGRFYLTALFFWLFGKSLVTFSWLCILLLSIKDLLTYLCARALMTRPYALGVTIAVIVIHGPIHKVFLTLSAMLILYTGIRLLKKPSRINALIMGLCSVLAGLFRYDMGAAALILCLMVLLYLQLKERKAYWGYVILGLVIFAGPVAAYFLGQGVDPALFIKNHLIRLNSLEHANADMPTALTLILSSDPQEYLFGCILLVFFVVFLCGILVLFIQWRRKEIDSRNAFSLLLCLVMILLLYNQVRLGVKFSRFAQICPPIFILLAYLLQTGYVKFQSKRWVFPLSGLVVFLGLCLYIWFHQGYQSQDSFAVLRMKRHYIDNPRVRCYFRQEKGKNIEQVIKFIEKAVPKGDAVFTCPSCALFNFFCDRPNPLPFTDFTFYYFNEENQRLAIKAIEDAQVEFAIRWNRVLTGFVFSQCAPILDSHLQATFAFERNFGPFMILKRRR